MHPLHWQQHLSLLFLCVWTLLLTPNRILICLCIQFDGCFSSSVLILWNLIPSYWLANHEWLILTIRSTYIILLQLSVYWYHDILKMTLPNFISHIWKNNHFSHIYEEHSLKYPRLLGGIFAAWWSSGAVHRDTRGTLAATNKYLYHKCVRVECNCWLIDTASKFSSYHSSEYHFALLLFYRSALPSPLILSIVRRNAGP